MVHRTRGRGDAVPNSAAVLDAMGQCRRVIIQAQAGVRPFGVAWHALAMVPAAIDAVALFVTGKPDFYSTRGSVPPPAGPMP